MAGFLAGMAGGVVLGFPFTAILIANAEAFAGPLAPSLFWVLHMLLSTAIGVAFSLFFAPRSYRNSIAAALAFVLVGVYGGGRAVTWAFTGAPLALDARMAMELCAHLLYAITLGGSYVYFHRGALYEAARADSPKWREWAYNQRRNV